VLVAGQPATIADLLQCSGAWVKTSLGAETDALVEPVPGNGLLLAGTPNGLLVTRDAGTSWRRVSGRLGHTSTLALSINRQARIVLAGTGDGGIYLTGLTGLGAWRNIGTLPGGNPVFALTSDPHNAGVVLAATVGGVFRGANVAGAWHWLKVVDSVLASATAFAWVPGHPHSVVASEFGVTPAVLQSNDEGLTWHADARGLPATLPVQALVALPSYQAVELTTMGGGVWVRGVTGSWSNRDMGLPEHHAMALVVDQSSGAQVAGTMGYGVYARIGLGPWRRIGAQLLGTQFTVLSLMLVDNSNPQLLAGTAQGLYRYVVHGSG
jgi:hypothetical protein